MINRDNPSSSFFSEEEASVLPASSAGRQLGDDGVDGVDLEAEALGRRRAALGWGRRRERW